MTFGTWRGSAGRYNKMINLLKRHSWFIAAAGVCSLIAAGLPLLVHFLARSQPAGYATPGWIEIGAFAVFGLALSAAMLDKNRPAWRLWASLCVQSASILVIAIH